MSDGRGAPFVLHVERRGSGCSARRRRAEGLREAGVVVGAGQEVRRATRTRRSRGPRAGRRCGRRCGGRPRRRAARGRRAAATGCSTTWNIVLSRPCGLRESVPNVATPAMLTAGPTWSDGSACRSLCVNCARVSFTVRVPSVSVLLKAIGLVAVVEPGRGRRRVEAAGAARVLGVDVVEAVADAELVAAADRVIDLAEHVQAVHRVVVEPGRDRRPGVADRREPGVDDRGVGVG